MKTNIWLLFIGFAWLMAACVDDDKKKEVPAEPSENIIEISTDYGNMYVWLYKETPGHRANFFKLIDSGIINGTEFHRVIKDFVIQGGDPLSKDSIRTNDGTGGPGYNIPAEIDTTKFKHKYGAIGAARKSDAVNPARESNGSQFYIVVNKNGQKSLDGLYTVFGEVIQGMEVADTISKVPKNGSDLPTTRIPMQIKVLKKTISEIENTYGFKVE